ncbi:MAG: hypothetical protein IPF63_11060 [Bacteroidetes bacterium]|nr:hypothetical protein [Bacteroidota bacterium]
MAGIKKLKGILKDDTVNILTKLFKKEKVVDNNVTIDTDVEEISSPISEPILNHLRMKTTGACFSEVTGVAGRPITLKIYFPLIEKDY